MVGHVDDGVRRGIERAIAAIAAAVHLRVRAKAGEQHDHRLKKFLFHRFSFQAAAGSGCFSCGFFQNTLIEPEQCHFSKARFCVLARPHPGPLPRGEGETFAAF